MRCVCVCNNVLQPMLFIDQGRSLQNKEISVPIPQRMLWLVIGPPTERSEAGIQIIHTCTASQICVMAAD